VPAQNGTGQDPVKDSDRDKSMGRASGWQCHRMAQGGGNSPVTITAKAVETENCHMKLQLKLPQKISANEQKKLT